MCFEKIISIDGEKEADSFTLRHDNLTKIVSKIPSGTKVAVVSVVGAFRTGKSFLLSFFLRYLRDGSPEDLSDAWMTKGGTHLLEGNMNDSPTSSDVDIDQREASFAWRGGVERQTTGIWMWSEPFLRHSSEGQIAILLMDTQGMFDNETGMGLTAQIFGLSTFVSSYQVRTIVSSASVFIIINRMYHNLCEAVSLRLFLMCHVCLFTRRSTTSTKNCKKTISSTWPCSLNMVDSHSMKRSAEVPPISCARSITSAYIHIHINTHIAVWLPCEKLSA